jgi:hypothetical protein
MMLNRKGKQILYKHHRRPRTAIYPEIQEYMMLWSLEKKRNALQQATSTIHFHIHMLEKEQYYMF